MSVVKIKFAGMLRGLLRRFDNEKPVAPQTLRQPAAVPPPAAPKPPQPRKADYASPPASPTPSAPSAQPFRSAPSPQAGPGEILLPVTQILMTLPLDLRAKIVGSNTVGMMISLPVEPVLAQLATGSVKITFGELRRLAPGVFASFGGDCDAKPVTLPLNEILAQLNPALLARRAAQKKSAELSDEVISPFNIDGQGLTISTSKMKSPSATPPPPSPVPLSRLAPAPEAPAPAPRVAQPPPGFTPRWNLPATNGNGHANGAPQPATVSAAPVPPANTAPIPPAAALPGQAQPAISVPLAALSESWPDALRDEIELLDLMGAQIALPIHLVEPALKRGRVIFSWRCMRPWIQSAAVAVSSHDDLELELPLKVLAPLLFTQKNGPAKAQKKTAVSEEIPNLFFGFPQPAAAPVSPAPAAPTPPAPAAPLPPPSSAPVPLISGASLPPMPASAPAVAASPLPETNFFIRANQPQTSDSEFRRKGGTDFLSRAIAPGEVVSRAMALPGVAGVIVALPDGLKVASQIPPDLNGDTLAAFLPQIFARVNQCSRELRMGDMNNLSFTVGNVPWKIFRVNAVYFAAFGRANESLPSAQLATLAAALDRKKT
jgi:predicted regulator of Ras-like GTPase activity (Roadblock/LC7/MglB family)